ncbi:MAG: M24 family metallopeptidase [bacterium]|nr:M24 family metallopeptidase [bacterium]
MILIKTSEEIKIMAEGGKILAKIMAELEKAIGPGIATKELNRLAEGLIFEFGGKPSFKDYDGFPASLCVSINEQVVHALPGSRIIKQGDLVSLDLGILYKGLHTDMARTFAVGKASPLAEKLIVVTKKALEIAKKTAKPGIKLEDISRAIQQYVESQVYSVQGTDDPSQAKLGNRGFNVIRELCGHGIGRELHEEPQILNFVGEDYGGDEEVILKEGMVFCVEPMVAAGHWKLKKSSDSFGYETKDGSLSCHFEDTVALTVKGLEVLTRL